MNEAAPKPPARESRGLRRWIDVVRVFGRPRLLAMLALGFSSGLPFYLVYQSLSAWLRQSHIDRATIGMLAWVGFVYALKFTWSPIVDRLPIPLLTRRLGRRRSWMLLAQAGIVAGIFSLARSDPAGGVLPIAAWALFLAFCAATQDIAIDAWRIETARAEEQGAMAAAYQFGSRTALVVGSSGVLAIAATSGWHAGYATMAWLALTGVVTTLLCREPRPAQSRETLQRERRVVDWLERRAHWPASLREAGGWFIGAVICPLTDFVARYRLGLAMLCLAFTATYRMTDYVMGAMATTFYVDSGYRLTQIATVRFWGVVPTLVGIAVSGVLITRIGVLRSLALGSVLVIVSNLGFAWLASARTPDLLFLGVANSIDNLALALHGTALITFLSGLTSARYTATQYALFSSVYALPGKFLEGFSGFVVNALGYPRFFVYTACLSLPALALLALLAQRRRWDRLAGGAAGA